MRAADWATIASLATAVGTLVLAVATFSSVRSANRLKLASKACWALVNRTAAWRSAQRRRCSGEPY